MRNIRRISIIGGGNIGTQFACTCAHKGYDVSIYTSTPEKYDGDLMLVGDTDNLTLRESWMEYERRIPAYTFNFTAEMPNR